MARRLAQQAAGTRSLTGNANKTYIAGGAYGEDSGSEQSSSSGNSEMSDLQNEFTVISSKVSELSTIVSTLSSQIIENKNILDTLTPKVEQILIAMGEKTKASGDIIAGADSDINSLLIHSKEVDTQLIDVNQKIKDMQDLITALDSKIPNGTLVTTDTTVNIEVEDVVRNEG